MLKISPDLERIQREMAVLAGASTSHVPTLFEMDPSQGALLMEDILPGVQLLESGRYPSVSDVAELLAPRIGVDARRLLDWCTAFAAMTAADLGGTGQRAEAPSAERSNCIRTALSLAMP